MDYTFKFTEEEYIRFLNSTMEKNEDPLIKMKIEKYRKIILIILMISIYLVPAIFMVGNILFIFIWSIFSALINLIIYFVVKGLSKKANNSYKRYTDKINYKLQINEKDEKRVIVKDNIFSYFSSTESIMFKVSNISHIKEDDLFIIISYKNDKNNIYIPLRVLNHLNEHDKFIEEIKKNDDNNSDLNLGDKNIYTNKFNLDIKDIKISIKYLFSQKRIINIIIKVILPVILMQCLALFVIYLMLSYFDNRKMIFILIVLAIATFNLIGIPLLIKKTLMRKLFINKDNEESESNYQVVFINDNGIYTYNKDICVGLNWSKDLVLKEYNNYFFVTKESRLISIIPKRAFSNKGDCDKFIRRIENYISKSNFL
ncbi:MAG: hypothetical protein E6300_10975 [Clostridium sp.]|uniref:hypothetical protein n=1 Tax=Clostridium sp. TaxID=1506 RepID=UPI001ED69EAA|nr:hypothetical protein [Clostridium sp.]MBS5884565.1 hypothetical protein [Clostridium sp.]MDU7149001.1 hypothetical protein [Clostridium sp.]